MNPRRLVTIADHTPPSIRPITTQRGSPVERAGISRWSLSSHNRWAWVKSIPCFALFVSDLARSNSNVHATGYAQKGIKKDLTREW